MKFRLPYYTGRLLKQNLPLIMGLLFFCAVSILFVQLNLSRYKENRTQIASLQRELESNTEKKKLLDFKSQAVDTEFDLDAANQILGQLIPVEEDYFTLLAALEKLSLQTNFVVTSYNIIVSRSTRKKLAVSIEGQGDPEAFLKFLSEYNFSGGRLITIDKIEFSQEAFSGSRIDLNFYTGKASSSVGQTTSVDVPLMKEIMSKVQLEIRSQPQTVSDYATKTNPF